MNSSIFVLVLLLKKIKNYELDIYELIYKLVDYEYIKFKYKYTVENIYTAEAYRKYDRTKNFIAKNMILNSEQNEQWKLFQNLMEKIIKRKYFTYVKYRVYTLNKYSAEIIFIKALEKRIIRKHRYPDKMLTNFCNYIKKRYHKKDDVPSINLTGFVMRNMPPCFL